MQLKNMFYFLLHITTNANLGKQMTNFVIYTCTVLLYMGGNNTNMEKATVHYCCGLQLDYVDTCGL